MEAMTGRARGGSRLRDLVGALEPAQWRAAALMAGVVLGLHAIGFFLLFALVVPHH